MLPPDLHNMLFKVFVSRGPFGPGHCCCCSLRVAGHQLAALSRKDHSTVVLEKLPELGERCMSMRPRESGVPEWATDSRA